ncbi:hypothetical protein [Chryseobacterium oryctis]|uniref:Uncharacterized protein n=1 Tax=Chryseobacterium oryctis TaxID=2952618 RepID=A0ABT3HPV8_9FLAO|nr:hypothetical protein [Chryseobacterium oryctis]MCW3161798.1 hypothetical protein [Chryseobacterium oryctis]
MKVRLLIFIFLLFNIFLKSQSFSCEDFLQTIEGNLRTKIDLVTEEYFNLFLKDSIKIPEKNEKEIHFLQNEFNKKYPNRITKHCINSKIFTEGKVEYSSYCSEKTNIVLIDKVENYYIFNLKAFEIDDYLLFNINNETLYFFNSIPVILDNGNTLIEIKFGSEYSHGVNIYKFENEGLKNFNVEFSRQYNLEKSYIIKDWANRAKILLKLVRYDLKEVSNTFKDGVKYEYDKERYCRKFLVISK